MENEVMNVEVMDENEVVNEIVPVDQGVETSDDELSRKDMIIGGVVLGFAAAGIATAVRGVFKIGKAIYHKFNDKKEQKVEAPVVEEINEQPVPVQMPTSDTVTEVEEINE